MCTHLPKDLLVSFSASDIDLNLRILQVIRIVEICVFDDLVDTKNLTYLTPKAMKILRSHPYSEINIAIDEALIMIPSLEKDGRTTPKISRSRSVLMNPENSKDEQCSQCHTLVQLNHLDESDAFNQEDHEYSNSRPTVKRSRQMTYKGKQYAEDRQTSRK